MRHHSNRPESQRGSILLPVALLTLVLGGLSIGLLTEGLAERASVNQRRSNLVAMQICEMGLIRASMEIFAQKDAAADGIGFASGPFADGRYEVSAVQDVAHPDRWVLTARGEYKFAVRRIEVGVRRRAGGEFIEGLFAKDTMTFNGKTQTDAYDSRLGTWSAQAVNADGGGAYASDGGHIGSNGDIVLNGSSVTIRGNALPGPLRETRMSGGPTVWGDIFPRRREIELPPVTLADFQAAMNANANAGIAAPNGGGNGGGNPKVKGGNAGGGGGKSPYNATDMSLTAGSQTVVTLSGGTYFFSDLRLSGQASLLVDGPTIIYVTRDLDVSGGGFVNSSSKPGDLIIYAHPYPLPPGHTPTAAHVKIRGGSQAAMAVYAPGAAVSVAGNDDVFGSFVGSTITVAGNTSFHYDSALGDTGMNERVTLERLYWRDLNEQLR